MAKSAPLSWGKTIFCVFSFSLFFLALLFHIWSRYQTTRLGYDLSVASRQEKELLEEQKTLRIEINKLSALDRVEKIARDQLNLKEPKSGQVIFVTEEMEPVKKKN